jgi:hypothetical protein
MGRFGQLTPLSCLRPEPDRVVAALVEVAAKARHAALDLGAAETFKGTGTLLGRAGRTWRGRGRQCHGDGELAVGASANTDGRLRVRLSRCSSEALGTTFRSCRGSRCMPRRSRMHCRPRAPPERPAPRTCAGPFAEDDDAESGQQYVVVTTRSGRAGSLRRDPRSTAAASPRPGGRRPSSRGRRR